MPSDPMTSAFMRSSGDLPDHASGDSSDDENRIDRPRDDGAGRDDPPLADRDAGEDDRSGSDPNVVLDHQGASTTSPYRAGAPDDRASSEPRAPR